MKNLNKNEEISVYRRHSIVVKRSSPLYKEIDEICFKSKSLFNATLYAEKQFYFNTGKFKFFQKICQEFAKTNQPDYRALPAKVSRCTQKKVDQAIKSFLALKKSNNTTFTPQFPKYLKKDERFIAEYPNDALSFKKKGFIRLSKTNIYIPLYKLIDSEDASIKMVRLVPKIGYYLIEILYLKKMNKFKKKKLTHQTKFASIDLGLNNLATVTSNVFEPLILNG